MTQFHKANLFYLFGSIIARNYLNNRKKKYNNIHLKFLDKDSIYGNNE